ncbi:acetolactate decarboxylase [Clostridium sp.]|uniref:acetolactate decarboxylase n=1 Tax=Clostridium sp. TaxID=1506 RepID=UPI002625864F|nr:acetolactate decarboxylase [Clostridium sp.]
MSKKLAAIVTGALLCSFVAGFSSSIPVKAETLANAVQSESNKNIGTQDEKKDNLYQVSLLNALMQGDYDGSVSVGELLKHGDTGLGTFDKLDGEMIVINGEVYKAKSDGTVQKQPNTELTPFAAVTFMNNDYTLNGLDGIKSLDDLKAALDKAVKEQAGDKNAFYMVRIDGEFNMAHVRSVPEQVKPYRPLSQVAAEQKEYEYNNVKGTIVALYCPDYMAGINLPTWHFHFITDQRDKGGHLLGINIKSAKGIMDKMDNYNLVLPSSSTFVNMELATDLSQETQKTESK